ncbi:hypothetical protein LguiA_009935 [Lonicera macranthoides]
MVYQIISKIYMNKLQVGLFTFIFYCLVGNFELIFIARCIGPQRLEKFMGPLHFDFRYLTTLLSVVYILQVSSNSCSSSEESLYCLSARTMGRVQENDQTAEMGIPVSGQAIGSVPQSVQPPMVGNPWQTGLFDCQSDAVMTIIAPCVTFGQIAEILDEGELSCPLGSFIYLIMMPALCSHWIMGSKYRAKLRKKFDLVEAPYEDAISHALCPCCSLSQEFRELQLRGLNPALGWNGVLAQQQQGHARNYHNQQAQNAPPIQAMSM